jgi:hypothetical protein
MTSFFVQEPPAPEEWDQVRAWRLQVQRTILERLERECVIAAGRGFFRTGLSDNAIRNGASQLGA